MNIIQSIGNTITYLSEGAFRWFSRNQDEYPNTGVQPFSGEPFSKSVEVNGERVKSK